MNDIDLKAINPLKALQNHGQSVWLDYIRREFQLADIAELWRRGSVVASWLLDLNAKALLKDPDLKDFSGHVSDRRRSLDLAAAIDQGTPAPVLTAALNQRFTSRGEDEFAAKMLSAMRFEFGGHVER